MRISDDGEYILCSNKDCISSIKNHQWGRIKSEGWFFSRKYNEAFCPEHVPVWLAEWRKKRGAQYG